MPDADRPLSPHLQIYRWQITMVLSILHRATGVAMSMGLLLLVLWLLTAATGLESYTRLRELLSSPPGLLILVGLIYSLTFHLCNGIRHLFWDIGKGFEKPQYHASGWMVVVGSLLLTTSVLIVGSGVLA